MKATITIKDECNCKITGLDPSTRKKLHNKFKYEVPGAYHIPSVKLGRWDGKIAFFQMGGSTFINLLPEILEDLTNEGYEIDLDDRRDYDALDIQLDEVTETSYAQYLWPDGHPVAGQPVTLRDYQVEIINGFLADTQGVQEVATGAGKTLITAVLSQKCESLGRSIVIVPNKSLVTQTEEDYINMGLDVGVFFGDRKEYGRTHTICTWQSLGSLMKKTAARQAGVTLDEFLIDVVAVIVDECFDGDTLITTPTGKIAIKNLAVGDAVINLCEKTNTYKEDVIVKVHKNLPNSSSEDMLKLEFDNGSIIKVTANHEFLTNNGWVRADQLTDDLDIIDINTYNSVYVR